MLSEYGISPYIPDTRKQIERNTHRVENPFPSSDRISNFLNTVTPGQRYGFFDIDQTIWPANIDMEEIAFEEYGVIKDAQAWERATERLKTQGGDAYLVEGRKANLEHYTQIITADLSNLTGIPEGTRMGPQVMRHIGRAIGHQLIGTANYRTSAVAVLKKCNELNIKPVFISASPVDLAEGVMDIFLPHFGIENATTLGTEDHYDAQGKVTESIFVYGPTKTAIVDAAIQRGGQAFVGMGDKFTTSDYFIHRCKIKGHVNNNASDRGEEAFKTVMNHLVTYP